MGIHKTYGLGKRAGAQCVRNLAAAIIFAMLFLFGALCAVTAVIQKGSISIQHSGIIGKGLYAAAGTIGGFLAAKKNPSGKLLWAALSSITLFLIELAAIYLFPGNPGISVWKLFAMSLSSGLLGGFLGCLVKRRGYV